MDYLAEYKNLLLPVGAGLAAYALSPSDSAVRNALLITGGVGLYYGLSQNRSLSDVTPYKYGESGTLNLTKSGIVDIQNSVLPLPTANISVPNAIDLPGGQVFLVPPPAPEADGGPRIPRQIYQEPPQADAWNTNTVPIVPLLQPKNSVLDSAALASMLTFTGSDGINGPQALAAPVPIQRANGIQMPPLQNGNPLGSGSRITY